MDHDWEVDRRLKIVAYLRSGFPFLEELGYSYCRFKDGPPDSQMGCRTFTDGIWEWPEGLAIYLEQYHVRLPDEFIKHAEENNFILPDKLDVSSRSALPVDLSFWAVWCRKERKKHFFKMLCNVLTFKLSRAKQCG